jgi:translation initiation factor 2 alpha subunit (eIF-2alpha)
LNYKEGDIVLCTVTKIVGTTVFIKIEDNSEGSISTSEIASGRIRNLRDYVVPNKKIVCKILRVRGDQIDLSLRRVTAKERDEVIEQYKKEQTAIRILKSISEKADSILLKIQNIYGNAADFLEEGRQNPKILNDFFEKQEAEKLIKILSERKERRIEIKKYFLLHSNESEGLELIKKLLGNYNISYLGGGKYLLVINKAKDFKQGNQEAREILEKIESRSKELRLYFESKEKI